MNKIKKILQHGIMQVLMILIYLPISWVIMNSFKTSKDILLTPFDLKFSPTLENYKNAWSEVGLGSGFMNSAFITIITVASIVLLSSMVAYILAKKEFKTRNLVYMFFVTGLMLPTFLSMGPLFLLVNKLNLLNTHIGLILVYTAYSLPFTIFMLVPFFEQVPSSLEEAAMIDGIGQIKLFFKIYFPLAKPGIITAMVFNFVGIWNEYVLALILITDDKMKTLPVKLANLMMVQQYKTDWGALYAGIVLSFVPVIIFYLIFQKQLIEGSISGAVK